MFRYLIKRARRHRVGDALPASLNEMAATALTRVHGLYHAKLYKRMTSLSGYLDLEGYVRENTVPITAPVALISQIERSGGSLLSQLFDGHPSVAAYPHELRFGLRLANHDVWPESLTNFREAADLKMQRLLKHGFRKGRHGLPHEFFMSPRIQKLIFDDCSKKTPRQSFDAFFTAFFNAWLDYRNDLRGIRFITAFAPRIALNPDNVSRFFKSYPDGFLIQIARDFESWSRSADPFYAGLGRPLSSVEIKERWSRNAASIERNKRDYGDRVLTVSFADLRGNPSVTMARLCNHLGLEDHPALREPTFNGQLTWANSSFSVQAPGLLKSDTFA